jgi:hypothetical protein
MCSLAWHLWDVETQQVCRMCSLTKMCSLTWRWDVETQQELLCQEGHARALYNIAFQSDGALAASVGAF